MSYSKIKDAVVNSKNDGNQWFLDLVREKASPEARERIERGIRMDATPTFFKTDDGTSVPCFTDANGVSTVFELDLKKVDESNNLAKYDTQLRQCGIEEYSRVSFDNINTYKFLGKKTPKDLIPMFDQRPLVYLFGGAGTGKTTLACAIGRDFARRGHPVVIRRWSNWLQQFREVWDDKSDMMISEHMQKAQNSYLLILDEIGNDKKKTATEFEIEQLSRIVSDRYGNGKPMIMTSNIDPQKLENIYGSQISSRITDTNKSLLQRFDGETDYRKTPKIALVQPRMETF